MKDETIFTLSIWGLLIQSAGLGYNIASHGKTWVIVVGALAVAVWLWNIDMALRALTRGRP